MPLAGDRTRFSPQDAVARPALLLHRRSKIVTDDANGGFAVVTLADTGINAFFSKVRGGVPTGARPRQGALTSIPIGRSSRLPRRPTR